MALKYCPNCGNLVSEYADRCPHCNYQLPHDFNDVTPEGRAPKSSRGLWIALYVILGLILATLIFLGVSYYLSEKREAEMIAQEKLRQDSIEKAELAAAEEQARLQDSIARVEEATPYLSLSTFCSPTIHPDTDLETGRERKYKIYEVKSGLKIENALKSLGFTCQFRNSRQEYYEVIEEYVTVTSWTYVKPTVVGPLTVKYDGEMTIDISFQSQIAANNFMATFKGAGFRYNRDREAYMMPGNDVIYWTGLKVTASGTNVKLVELWAS